jgi:hypothetical protein
MRQKKFTVIVIECFTLLLVLGIAHRAMAQDDKTTYPKMAPLDQYLMADRKLKYRWRAVPHQSPLHGMQRCWFLPGTLIFEFEYCVSRWPLLRTNVRLMFLSLSGALECVLKIDVHSPQRAGLRL